MSAVNTSRFAERLHKDFKKNNDPSPVLRSAILATVEAKIVLDFKALQAIKKIYHVSSLP